MAFDSSLPVTPEICLTCARSVARLTWTSATPGIAWIAFSIRRTQDAQVMPAIWMLLVDMGLGGCMAQSPMGRSNPEAFHDGKVKALTNQTFRPLPSLRGKAETGSANLAMPKEHHHVS